MNKQKQLGQYFTPELMADFMVSLSEAPKNSNILEPSSGEGIFLDVLLNSGYQNVLGVEVDEKLVKPNHKSVVRIESFINSEFSEKFDLIIGNPPYVRWKNMSSEQKLELNSNTLWQKYFNSLCDYLYIFILKSVELLKPGGELIFITPEYWISTTHSNSLRNYLVEKGYFSHIYQFIETPIFDNVASSTIVFRYIKNETRKETPEIKVTKYNSNKKLNPESLLAIQNGINDPRINVFLKSQFSQNSTWLLSSNKIEEKLDDFESKCKFRPGRLLISESDPYVSIGEIADIGNGMVSGLDKAFQLPDGMKLLPVEQANTIEVVKARYLKPFFYEETTKYIFFSKPFWKEEILRENFPNFYSHLNQYKDKLEKRYSYNREIPYWHWVFLRNLNQFSASLPRIFVPCKERISHKDYFRFAFAEEDKYPTQDVSGITIKPETKESIYYILAYLNSKIVFNWIKNKGIIKGNIIEFSHRPIASIPFRMINWNDPIEVKIHSEISDLTREYISERDQNTKKRIDKVVNDFIGS